MIMIRPLELSRPMLLMCTLLCIKADKSEVLISAKAVHGLRSVAWILVTLSLCFSQSLEALTCVEILCDSELTVNIF